MRTLFAIAVGLALSTAALLDRSPPRRATPERGTLDGLLASGPAPDVADDMMVFGRLVGSWDIAYTAYLDSGKTLTATCEWNWAWVLDGRAVQDVWVCPSRAERKRNPKPGGEWGTTVRMYDPKRDVWKVVFVGPAYANMNTLTAHAQGAVIVQDGTGGDGQPVHWNFTDITPTSFRWYSEKSKDGGRTWVHTEQMLARRRPIE